MEACWDIMVRKKVRPAETNLDVSTPESLTIGDVTKYIIRLLCHSCEIITVKIIICKSKRVV